jgi:hypothetical protein
LALSSDYLPFGKSRSKSEALPLSARWREVDSLGKFRLWYRLGDQYNQMGAKVMAKDLFSEKLELISFTDVEEFLGMSSPVAARPTEGALLDYKVDDSGDWVDAVAAFANTAGGLLFFGVQSDKRQNNAPIAVPGLVFSGGDIKARLTAKIVSQVSPRPEFDIGAMPLPTDSNRFIVVLRVREGTYPPYQYAKERDKIRFPIRVQDTSRQATLRDMEYLFGKRGAFAETTEVRIQQFFAEPLFPQLLKDFSSQPKAESTTKPFHVWSVRPRAPLRLRLDRSFDQFARELVARNFPDSGYGQFWPPIMSGDRHIIQWQAAVDSATAPQLRWARNIEWTSSGDLRFAERIDRRDWNEGESISDLFISGLRFLNLVEEFYRSRSSFGSLSALHTVHLQSGFKLLLTFPGEDGNYRETDAIFIGPMQRTDGPEVSNATSEIENFATGNRVALICDIMLSHLRQLRQANIDYSKLTNVVALCPIDKPLGYFP